MTKQQVSNYLQLDK